MNTLMLEMLEKDRVFVKSLCDDELDGVIVYRGYVLGDVDVESVWARPL